MKQQTPYLSVITVLLISVWGSVFAARGPEWVTHSTAPTSPFHHYVDIPQSGSSIPKVVELTGQDFTAGLSRGYLIVGSETTSAPVSGYLKTTSGYTPVKITAADYPQITDGDITTFATLPFQQPAQVTSIKFYSKDPITSDTLTISLDKYVSSPERVSLTASSQNGIVQVVASKPLSDLTFHFPETKAREWDLVFYSSQPLRVGEVVFSQKDTAPKVSSLLFLRQPWVSYRIYFNPEKPQTISTNYQIASEVLPDKLILSTTSIFQNPSFVMEDQDKDGIADAIDNCPRNANADQKDTDGDGREGYSGE